MSTQTGQELNDLFGKKSKKKNWNDGFPPQWEINVDTHYNVLIARPIPRNEEVCGKDILHGYKCF